MVWLNSFPGSSDHVPRTNSLFRMNSKKNVIFGFNGVGTVLRKTKWLVRNAYKVIKTNFCRVRVVLRVSRNKTIFLTFSKSLSTFLTYLTGSLFQ